MAKRKSIYSVHPSMASVQTQIARLKEKTGRTLDQWVAFIKKSGPKTEKERREWLKQEHGLGTNYSWWLAQRADGKGEEDTDPERYLEAAERWVEEMYAQKRAALRPIYERLLKAGLALGSDVQACPCKTMVPLYRKHVFAQIKPATNSRIDLGLYLKGVKISGKRLINTGGEAKGDRITHRIPIEQISQVDAEVTRWLKTAYDLSE